MKIGVALSGGGIRGIAHAGVLKALKENNIKIDIIGGTSAGGMVASLYAMGIEPEQIHELFKKYAKEIIGTKHLPLISKLLHCSFSKKITLTGFNNGESIEKIYNKIAKEQNIEKISQIQMPLVIPSVDIMKPKEYIFTNNIMDKEHLLELYKILSDGLLSSSDMARMGEYYREDKVYILRKGRIDMELSEGIDYSLIDKYMDIYFDYVNDNSDKTMTDEFIKSQIMHFYFVYIHPYFDVNGRSSRTMAMWYLLNNKAYPYIIFNRAISNNSSTYDETITDTRNNANISFFIRYMMINVKRELEKELIIQEIRDNTSVKMTMMDYQALNYILSMKGEKNVLTFTSLYRRDNGYKRVRDVYLQILLPLIDKKIIEIVRTTNKEMFSGYNNEVFRINTNRFDVDNPKIKRLNLKDN